MSPKVGRPTEYDLRLERQDGWRMLLGEGGSSILGIRIYSLFSEDESPPGSDDAQDPPNRSAAAIRSNFDARIVSYPASFGSAG